MARLYTKVEELAEIIVQRQEAGETYREIGASLGLSKPYVCAVLDLCEKAVLALKIGSDMSSSMVANTIREALKQKRSLMDSHSTVTKGLNTQPKQTSTILKNTMFLRLYPAPAFLMKTQQWIASSAPKPRLHVSHSFTLTG